MAANKSPSPKKKASARQNAAEKISRRGGGGAEAPRVPHSDKEISQSRFPGETPLTGEDRPSTHEGDKQEGYRQDQTIRRGPVNPDTKPAFKAPAKKRRPSRSS